MFVVCLTRAYNLLEACTYNIRNKLEYFSLLYSYLSGKSNVISYISYEKIEKKIYSSWYHNNITKVY